MRKVRIIWPNGTDSIYESVKNAGKDIGCTQQTMRKALKNNKLGHTNIEVRYVDGEDTNKQ